MAPFLALWFALWRDFSSKVWKCLNTPPNFLWCSISSAWYMFCAPKKSAVDIKQLYMIFFCYRLALFINM